MNDNIKSDVFINCPFDEDYDFLLRPMLFTLLYFGKNPRTALEDGRTDRLRLQKIMDIMKETRYSILAYVKEG
jgi:hypothetical protein